MHLLLSNSQKNERKCNGYGQNNSILDYCSNTFDVRILIIYYYHTNRHKKNDVITSLIQNWMKSWLKTISRSALNVKCKWNGRPTAQQYFYTWLLLGVYPNHHACVFATDFLHHLTPKRYRLKPVFFSFVIMSIEKLLNFLKKKKIYNLNHRNNSDRIMAPALVTHWEMWCLNWW